MCVLCLFVRVNFFRLKKVNCLDNLNYITNEIHPITNLKLFYHNLFQLSQSFSIITIPFQLPQSSLSQSFLSQSFSIITIFFNYHTIFFITILFVTIFINYHNHFLIFSQSF